MHYEGLDLLNEKLRIPCSLRHKNRKEKKIKTAEREEQLRRQVATAKQCRGYTEAAAWHAGSYYIPIYTYALLYDCSRNKT